MLRATWLSSTPALDPPWDSPSRELLLKFELLMLRQDLLAAKTVNHEYYEALIVSLFTALKRVQNSVCPNCKAAVEKSAPCLDIIDSAGLPSGPSSHFSRRIFKARRGGSLLSPTSDTAGSHAVHHKLAKSILRVSSTPSQPKKSGSNGWSVKISKDRPSFKMNLEHARSKDYNKGSVACVRFSSTGNYLAVGINNKRGGWKAKVYDTKTSKKESVLFDLSMRKNNPHLWSMCFSPNDRYLAIADSDQRISIWEIKKNLIQTVFKGHTSRVTSVDFSPRGRFLASSSTDRTVRIWSMRDGFSMVFEDNAQSYCQVRFSPDGRHVAAANDDGMLRIWNARTGGLVTRWRVDDNVLRRVVFTPDGKGLVIGGQDRVFLHWIASRLEKGVFETQSDKNKEILRLRTQASKDIGVCLDISPNGQWIVFGSHDQPIMYDIQKNWEWVCTFRGKQVLSADFSPTGDYLALVTADGKLAVWRYVAT